MTQLLASPDLNNRIIRVLDENCYKINPSNSIFEIPEERYKVRIKITDGGDYILIKLSEVKSLAKYMKSTFTKDADIVFLDFSRQNIYIIEIKDSHANSAYEQINCSVNWLNHLIFCFGSGEETQTIDWSIHRIINLAKRMVVSIILCKLG